MKKSSPKSTLGVGEIARKTANLVTKEKPYARGCHAETFTVPYSAIADRVLASLERMYVVWNIFRLSPFLLVN